MIDFLHKPNYLLYVNYIVLDISSFFFVNTCVVMMVDMVACSIILFLFPLCSDIIYYDVFFDRNRPLKKKVKINSEGQGKSDASTKR